MYEDYGKIYGKIYDKIYGIIAENDRLKVENEKLKQLVRDVSKVAYMFCEAWEGSCSKEYEGMSLHEVCPIGDTSEFCVFGRLDERMQELGIEVDE